MIVDTDNSYPTRAGVEAAKITRGTVVELLGKICPFTIVLTGHIDVLQVRYGKVWILAYKPDAKRETRAKYQLYLYARALSARTRIPLPRFGLAYFDDKDYFEVTLGPDGLQNGRIIA